MFFLRLWGCPLLPAFPSCCCSLVRDSWRAFLSNLSFLVLTLSSSPFQVCVTRVGMTCTPSLLALLHRLAVELLLGREWVKLGHWIAIPAIPTSSGPSTPA